MAGWSNVLKILKEAAPYVSTAGQVAGGIGAGRTAGRAQENAATMNRDQAAQERWQNEQQARLNAALLTENATKDRADRTLTNAQDRAKQVAWGDALANIQDAEISGLPSYIPKINISGGLRPSMFGPAARESGRNLAQQAMAAQLSGSDIPDLPDVSGLGGNAPELSPLQEGGKLDSILNMAGYASLPFQAYEERQRQQQERARLEREEARRATLEAQQRAALLAPQEVPTSLVSRTGLFGGTS